MRILEITFQAFFDDTQRLVSDGILADIEEVIAAADSEDTRNVKFLWEQGDLTWVESLLRGSRWSVVGSQGLMRLWQPT